VGEEGFDQMTTSKEPNRWKGLVLGLLGGAAGLIAMRGYWQAVRAVSGNDPRAETRDGPPHTSISLIGTNHQEGESSTAAVGRIIYRCIASEDPESQETRTLLSYLVHWVYGIAQGGLYGAARAHARGPDLAGGLTFATGLWLFGDEVIVSLLGLAEGPTRFPLRQHAHRWGAHLAYGLATAATTQLLSRIRHRYVNWALLAE
jgi:hypothetical protein